jgi:hypothetical protein
LTTSSADLRAYYAKHTRSDWLDSVLLARLPLLHPEGLHPERCIGPGDPLRRATKLHSTLVKRRTTSLARLDALLEILGPDWHAAFGTHLGYKTSLRFLAAGMPTHTVRRLGRARLARFFYRHSRAHSARSSLALSWLPPTPPWTCGVRSCRFPTWPKTSSSKHGLRWR